MELRRRLEISPSVIQDLAGDAEKEACQSCVKDLLTDPRRGALVVFSGYPGDHRVVDCGRFLFIYQFSDRKLRIKAVRLTTAFDD